MYTHTIIEAYQTSGDQVGGNTAVTGDTEKNSNVVLSASSTDVELDLPLDVSQLQSLVMHCTAACTVETNSGSAPDDTVSLSANIPVICKTNAECIALLGTDVTALFLTCSAGGTFNIRTLSDLTP